MIPALTVFYQGQGAVSADNLNTFVPTCDGVAYLRNFTGLAGMKVYLGGYNTPGDGGQGFFYWNSSGTRPDDNGVTCIQPYGAATGEWQRMPAPNSISGTAITSGTSALIPNGQAMTVLVLSSPAPFTVSLPPTPVANETHYIKDGSGNASTYPITVSGNGYLIDGSTTAEIGVNYGCLFLWFNGSTNMWNVLSQV